MTEPVGGEKNKEELLGEVDSLRAQIAALQEAAVRAEQERLEAESRQKQEVEQVWAAQERFLAQLSHELRTPLTPVVAAVEVLEEEGTPGPERLELVRMIRRNLALQTRLIDDLLDTTRIKGGKVSLRLEEADLHAAIQDVVQICEEEIAEKALRLTLDLTAQQRELVVDPARLRQMLWNLLKNAVKFTPVGGEIRIGTSDPETGWVQCAVWDSGIGISADVLPTLFVPFQQGAAEITQRFGGLGLGLSITKALAELHGGRIAAASAGVGRGSRFTLELPVGREGQEPAAAEARPGTAGQLSGRILLVEDHADTARALRVLLERRGHSVVWAASLRQAFADLEAFRFDMVLTDLQLPDGNGMELVEKLRVQGYPRVIVMTGAEGEETGGAFARIMKPVDVAVFDALVLRVLEGGP